MKLKAPRESAIETIGYARRSMDHPNMSYIGWTKGTVFDMELVYRDDLVNLDKAHRERYDELLEEHLPLFAESEQQCERIRELEQYISSVIVVDQRTEDNDV